jgi:hypothetical protein
MIVNPGVDSYPVSEKELENFDKLLSGIFNGPDVHCLIRYKSGILKSFESSYVEGVSDTDLLCVTNGTITGKREMLRRGKEIGEAFKSLGEHNVRFKYDQSRRVYVPEEGLYEPVAKRYVSVKGRPSKSIYVPIPKGFEVDLSVEDLPTLSKYAFTAFRTGFAEVFKNAKSLVGEYPKDIKIPSHADRELVHAARNLSQLRAFPLLRDVILRFGGNEELANIKYNYLIKIVDLPYIVSAWLNDYKTPESRAQAIADMKAAIKIPYEPLEALLNGKKSFEGKVNFMRPTEHDDDLLDGITWYEMVVEKLLPMVYNKPKPLGVSPKRELQHRIGGNYHPIPVVRD